MKKIANIYSVLFIIILFTTSCKENDSSISTDSSFNRKEMLEQYVNQFFIPHINKVVTLTNEINTLFKTYTSSQENNKIDSLQSKWKQLAIEYNKISMLNFGPGELQYSMFSEEIGTFPIDTMKVNKYIEKNDTTFLNFDRDTRGIFTLEYLLFYKPQKLLKISNKRYYAQAIIHHLQSVFSKFKTDWDTYKINFIADESTSNGSSTSNLYNNFIKYFEHLKTYKVGIPAGKIVGQTTKDTTQVESLYAKYSKKLLVSQIHFLWNFYLGINENNKNNKSFDDYVSASYGGSQLLQNTTKQYSIVKQKLDDIVKSPLSYTQLIQQESDLINQLFNALQNQTRYFKSDMSSILGIQITYQDGDGD